MRWSWEFGRSRGRRREGKEGGIGEKPRSLVMNMYGLGSL